MGWAHILAESGILNTISPANFSVALPVGNRAKSIQRNSNPNDLRGNGNRLALPGEISNESSVVKTATGDMVELELSLDKRTDFGSLQVDSPRVREVNRNLASVTLASEGC
jgi:hypothetical protein